MGKLNTAIKNLGEKVTGTQIGDFETIAETVDDITLKYEKISIATQQTAGTVKGSNEDFEVNVKNDGTMEVNGLNAIYNELTDINSGNGV